MYSQVPAVSPVIGQPCQLMHRTAIVIIAKLKIRIKSQVFHFSNLSFIATLVKKRMRIQKNRYDNSKINMIIQKISMRIEKVSMIIENSG